MRVMRVRTAGARYPDDLRMARVALRVQGSRGRPRRCLHRQRGSLVQRVPSPGAQRTIYRVRNSVKCSCEDSREMFVLPLVPGRVCHLGAPQSVRITPFTTFRLQ